MAGTGCIFIRIMKGYHCVHNYCGNILSLGLDTSVFEGSLISIWVQFKCL